MKILLVEDDPANARVATDFLTHRGHETCAVACGREAIQEASRNGFEVAIVDVGLPDLDGFAVVQELVELQPGLRCVLVSGQSVPDATLRAERLGSRFLPKPVDLAELEAWLAS